jgi:tetrahedral aminopeptidase
MQENIPHILEKMTSFHSVAGNEHAFAEWFKGEISLHADSVEVDIKGNIIARRGQSPKIALFAHMDSIGFMVKRVNGENVELVNVGNPKFAAWSRVMILGHKQEIPGVLIQRENSILVDTGLPEPAQYIRPGDFVSFVANFSHSGDLVMSKGLDDKIGCLIGLEVFRQVDNVILVGTVQEEQDPAGAHFAARELASSVHLALILDVTYDENLVNSYHIKIGQGPALCFKDSLLPDRNATKAMCDVAEANNIPFQIEVLEKGGSDAKEIAPYIPTLFVGVPLRYMHTPNELAHINDIKNTIQLVSLFVVHN